MTAGNVFQVLLLTEKIFLASIIRLGAKGVSLRFSLLRGETEGQPVLAVTPISAGAVARMPLESVTDSCESVSKINSWLKAHLTCHQTSMEAEVR